MKRAIAWLPFTEREKCNMIFSLGNPNVPAPEAVKKAIVELVEGEDPIALHGYTNSNSGYPEVRQAVADSLNERFGTSFGERNIIMTVGQPAV